MLSASADHVAAFVLEPRAVDRTDGDLHCCSSTATRRARAGFDPSDAVELWDLVNRQDWAICESVQRGMSSRAYRHGWFAPMEDDSLDIRRWLLPRLGGGAADALSGVDVRRRRPRRPRQRDRLGAGPPRPLGARAGAVRARPLPRREPRHQPDPAAQLPHAVVRPAHPGGVRRLGAARAATRASSSSPTVGGLDLFPPGRRPSARSTTPTSLDEVGIDYDVLDAAGRRARGGRSSGCPDGHARAAPGRRGDRAGRPRHPGDAGAGPAARRRPARPVAGARGARPRRPAGVEVTTGERTESSRRGVVV